MSRDDVIPAAGAASLRLLTLNIHKGFSVFNRRFVLPELREAIRTFSADIVCLQEVQGEHSRHASRHQTWPEQPQYEFLADSIWQQHAYGRNAVYTEGHHGNAVLSKFPIVRYDNYDISLNGPERRGLLHCVLQRPDQGPEVHVISLHLSLTENHRRQQLRKLCALIEQHVPASAPLLVAGDFNDWRGNAHRALREGAKLSEVFVSSTGHAARSFPARFPVLRLDRIYIRNIAEAAPTAIARKPWAHLSDHVPLIAEIRL